MKTIGTLLTAWLLFAAFAAGAQNVPTMAQIKAMQHQMAAENTANVGKVLPSGTRVLLANGNPVDLRDQLQGRTMLVKVKPKNCPPCEQLLAFIGANGAKIAKAQNARIVVLMVDSEESPPMSMQQGVTVLHTPTDMKAGFLGGTLTPTTFFFDPNHRLLKRSAGLTGLPERTLQFPVGNGQQ